MTEQSAANTSCVTAVVAAVLVILATGFWPLAWAVLAAVFVIASIVTSKFVKKNKSTKHSLGRR